MFHDRSSEWLYWYTTIQSLRFCKWVWIMNWSEWILIVDIRTQILLTILLSIDHSSKCKLKDYIITHTMPKRNHSPQIDSVSKTCQSIKVKRESKIWVRISTIYVLNLKFKFIISTCRYISTHTKENLSHLPNITSAISLLLIVDIQTQILHQTFSKHSNGYPFFSPQQCITLWSGVPPTKCGCHKVFSGNLAPCWRHLTTVWPLDLNLSMYFTLVRGLPRGFFLPFGCHLVFLSNLTPGWPQLTTSCPLPHQECITLWSWVLPTILMAMGISNEVDLWMTIGLWGIAAKICPQTSVPRPLSQYQVSARYLKERNIKIISWSVTNSATKWDTTACL